MRKKKCAVFSCLGLGDGLISFILSNNLVREGDEVISYHPFLKGMQDWFPSFQIKKFPEAAQVSEELESFDHFYIFFEKSSWMSQIIHYCQTHHPEKTTIINPIATPKTNYPYWENAKFNGSKPFVDNLEKFCKEGLLHAHPTKENGMTPPVKYQKGKYSKRVILHPTSSRPGKNWPQEKFLALANKLRQKGFEPSFILTQDERKGWPESTPMCPEFSCLSAMAGFVYESGFMIGNDSGIGHLASCLGLPTLTICRSKMSSAFWRPAWSEGIVLCPPSWIPNIKGLRWRDKHWKRWIPLCRVTKAFALLTQRD